MTGMPLISDAQNTWCPGCGNFSIQHALKAVLSTLESEGRSRDTMVLVTGIGCHAKMADYFNINSFYCIHGRTIPVATGIKIANPELTVICCAGDGDAYAEGLDHLLFGAKRNIDITVIVHNNRVYGLTTGQYTPTSPLGFRGRSTPAGTLEHPLNPMEMMLASGATFVGRGYSRRIDILKQLIREAILHQGFSFIDVLQICATYFDVHEVYDKYVYELKDHDSTSFDRAMEKAREWDYNSRGPIALGSLYRARFPTFDKKVSAQPISPEGRIVAIQRILDERR